MNRRKFLTKAALGVAVAPVVVKACGDVEYIDEFGCKFRTPIRLPYDAYLYEIITEHRRTGFAPAVIYTRGQYVRLEDLSKIQFDIPGSGW